MIYTASTRVKSAESAVEWAFSALYPDVRSTSRFTHSFLGMRIENRRIALSFVPRNPSNPRFELLNAFE